MAAGYIRNPLRLSLGYTYGSFSNSNPNLNFRNPATANTASATDTFTMPPDNYYYKVNFLGSLKLPFNSKLDMKLATGSAKSDATLLTSYVADVPGGLTNIALNKSNFNGQVDSRNFAMSLTSKPLTFLDGRLFVKYDETENKSAQITITDLTQSPATFTNTLFDYRNRPMNANGFGGKILSRNFDGLAYHLSIRDRRPGSASPKTQAILHPHDMPRLRS